MRRGAERRRRLGAVAVLVVSGMLGADAAEAVPAPARQTVVAWSTYLRAGPGETFAAITELEHDTRVAVVSCDARWCRISGAPGPGYVDRDALDLPRTRPLGPPATKDCVVVGQADNRGPIPTRFCTGSPSRR